MTNAIVPKRKHRAAAMRLVRFFRWLNEFYPPVEPVRALHFVSEGIEVNGDTKARGAYHPVLREIAVLMKPYRVAGGPTPTTVLAHEYAHHLQQFRQWPSRAWTPKNAKFRHKVTGKVKYEYMPRKEQWAFLFAFIAIRKYRQLMRAGKLGRFARERALVARARRTFIKGVAR